MFLAHVIVDLPGGRSLAAAELADAFMAVDAIVTVKIIGDCAECRVDVRGPTREEAADEAIAAAEAGGALAGPEPLVTSVKVQPQAERAAPLVLAMGR